MAKIRIDLAETLIDGMDIKFKAPCDCTEVTGLIVYYPAEDDTIKTKELTFRDAHGNDLTGVGNLFSKDAYVKVIADAVNGYAYPQNADNNGYLNSAIFGTYTHDAENLIGSGENGKFKATVSGTISSINVNGVSCSVKCGEDSSMDLIAGCWYTFIMDGNTVNFSSGGAGGGGLNFKVVGGTTQPVSPSENMIWVNTDVAISSYVVAAVEPSAPSEGMVWISTGTSSTVEFNALKKNGIQVYPTTARQYISGAWVDKEAKSYQSGAWVDWWNGELYVDGNQFKLITGGWANNTDLYAKYTTTYANSGAAPSFGTYISITAESNRFVNATTNNPIDLTKYSKLSYELSSDSSNSNCHLAIHQMTTGDMANNSAADIQPTPGTKGSIDISSLNGFYYVTIFTLNNRTAEFGNIRLE